MFASEFCVGSKCPTIHSSFHVASLIPQIQFQNYFIVSVLQSKNLPLMLAFLKKKGFNQNMCGLFCFVFFLLHSALARCNMWGEKNQQAEVCCSSPATVTQLKNSWRFSCIKVGVALYNEKWQEFSMNIKFFSSIAGYKFEILEGHRLDAFISQL